MAKAIIDVDLNDERFKQFVAAYAKWDAQVKALPGAWRAAEEAMQDTADAARDVGAATNQAAQSSAKVAAAIKPAAHQEQEIADQRQKGTDSIRDQIALFTTLTAALLAQNEIHHKMSEEREKQNRSLKQTERSTKTLARDTVTIARNIKDTTLSLLKWASITGVVGGIIGGGGLFGIDRLAQNAAGGRRSAQGLGITPAAQQAFDVNYQPYVNSEEYLHNLADVINTPGKGGLLGGRAAQLSQQGMSLDDIAAALLPQIKSEFEGYGRNTQAAQAAGLTDFMGTEGLRLLSNTKPGELGEAEAKRRQDRTAFQVPDKTLKAWQDFNVQLDRASKGIGDAFIVGLAPLVPQLEKLSVGFQDVIATFLKSDDTKKLMDEFADGLKALAGWIASPAFKSDVETFTHDVGELAKSIAGALHWLGGGDTPKTPAGGDTGTVLSLPGGGIHRTDPSKDPAWAHGAANAVRRWFYGTGATQGGAAGTPGASGGALGPAGAPSASVGGLGAPGSEQSAEKALRGMGWTEAQAQGIAANLARESNFDPTRTPDNGEPAYGLAQWHPDRQANFAKWAGHDIRQSTFDEQLGFVNYELRSGTEQAAGRALSGVTDSEEAARTVSRLYERPANENEEAGLRADIATLIRTLNSKLGGGATLAAKIDVNNQTGGSAVITGSQVAQ